MFRINIIKLQKFDWNPFNVYKTYFIGRFLNFFENDVKVKESKKGSNVRGRIRNRKFSRIIS